MKRPYAFRWFACAVLCLPLPAGAAGTAAPHIRPSTPQTQDFLSLARGFPALSRNGSHVIVAYTDTAGPEDVRSLLLALWDAKRSRLLVRKSLAGKATPPGDVNRRIADANRWLMRWQWTPMDPLLDETGGESTALANGQQDRLDRSQGRFRIRFGKDDHRLVVTDAASGSILFERVLAPRHSLAPHCPAHGAMPTGLWTDARSHILVLRIGYAGSDVCVEPPEEWVVLRMDRQNKRSE